MRERERGINQNCEGVHQYNTEQTIITQDSHLSGVDRLLSDITFQEIIKFNSSRSIKSRQDKTHINDTISERLKDSR